MPPRGLAFAPCALYSLSMSDWYYAVNNEQKGPVSESELKVQLAANRLPSDTLVWKDGMANWTAAHELPVFASRTAGPVVGGETLSGVTLTSAPASIARTPGANNPESVTPVSVSGLMTGGEALEVDAEDAENNKIFGILAYLSILWVVPLIVAKDSPFAKYHANQGLILFIVEIALYILIAILTQVFLMIPGLGFLPMILSLVWLGVIVLLIIGIVNAAAGKCVPLPIIGKFKLIK
jgi:uncharacterized membrane protein